MKKYTRDATGSVMLDGVVLKTDAVLAILNQESLLDKVFLRSPDDGFELDLLSCAPIGEATVIVAGNGVCRFQHTVITEELFPAEA